MPLVQESGRILSGIFNALGVILKPIVSFIGSLLMPIIQRLTSSLKVLEPILKVIGDVRLVVSTAFEWVAQTIRHLFAVIVNWFASWIPWVNAIEDPGAAGSFSEMWQRKRDEMYAGYDGNTLQDAAATQQAVSSASYRGGTSVVINIYADGPIVGDGGMRQFAAMIREEFEALDYYGVN